MKNVVIMVVMFVLVLVCVSAHAETSVIPMVGYGYMDVNGQDERGISGGLTVENGEAEPAVLGNMDYLMASAFYGNYLYGEKLDFGYDDEFHSIQAMVNYKKRAHEVLAIVSSDSADPFKNKRTFIAGAVYGYTLVYSDAFTLTLGGGLAGGGDYDLLPVPYIIAKYRNDILTARFDFITEPSLGIVIMPESRVNGLLDVYLGGFETEYLLFTAAVQCQPFAGDLDFVKFITGVKNDGHVFDTTEKETYFVMQAYSAFAQIDFGLAKLGGGYVFDSKEMYTNDGDITRKHTGTGYYVSAEALFVF